MRVTVGLKLGVLTGVGVLTALVVGGTAFTLVGSMRSQTADSALLARARAQACVVERELSDLTGVQQAALLAADDAHRADVTARFDRVHSDLESTWADIEALDLPPRIRAGCPS